MRAFSMSKRRRAFDGRRSHDRKTRSVRSDTPTGFERTCTTFCQRSSTDVDHRPSRWLESQRIGEVRAELRNWLWTGAALRSGHS